MKPDEYIRLKKQLDNIQQRAVRTEGSLDQLKKQMQDEFGVSNVPGAKSLLKTMEKKAEKMRTAFDRALADFNTAWPDVLK